MNPELQALLAVQREDEAIRAIEARLAALMPPFKTLEAACRRTADEAGRNAIALEREEARLRVSEDRLAESRVRLGKSEAILEAAARLRDATAAAVQLDAARKAVVEGESELLVLSRRVGDLRAATTAHREELERLTRELEAAGASISGEKAAMDAELMGLRSHRGMTAEGVGRPLLSLYERVYRNRRTTVVHALHDDFSCGACDTAIPLQRRPAMASGKCVEPCEACGVLLYYRVSTNGA